MFFFSFKKTHEFWFGLIENLVTKFSQKDYALHSKSFWLIDRNDSQIRLSQTFFDKRCFRKLEKNLKKFYLKKVTSPVFYRTIFFTNLLIFFWNINTQNQCSQHLQNGWFFKDFSLIRKYSKHSLNLTFAFYFLLFYLSKFFE